MVRECMFCFLANLVSVVFCVYFFAYVTQICLFSVIEFFHLSLVCLCVSNLVIRLWYFAAMLMLWILIYKNILCYLCYLFQIVIWTYFSYSCIIWFYFILRVIDRFSFPNQISYALATCHRQITQNRPYE
jgi:hypothetical protein